MDEVPTRDDPIWRTYRRPLLGTRGAFRTSSARGSASIAWGVERLSVYSASVQGPWHGPHVAEPCRPVPFATKNGV
jgi:hypothetical protein